MKKHTLLFVLLFVLYGTVDAQVLKSLKEKIAEKVGKTNASKNSGKNSAQADSVMRELNRAGFGDAINGNPFAMGMGMVDPSVLPEKYTFSHLYRIRMKAEKGDIEMDYYLTKSGNYIGNIVKARKNDSVTMVHDYEKRLIVNYLNGQPMVMRLPEAGQFSSSEKDTVVQIRTIPNKVILGHNCIGKQMENDDYLLTLYVAPDLGVGMCNPFEQDGAATGTGYRLRKKETNGGLVMQMLIVDKKKKGPQNNDGSMECILFEEKELIIKNR